MKFNRFARGVACAATLLSTGGIAAGFQVAEAPGASASGAILAPTYTWTGLSKASQNWSDSGNWDAAGAPGAVANSLAFPDLPSCDDGTADPSASCYNSTADTAVTASTLDLTQPTKGTYQIGGTSALTLTSGINVANNGNTSSVDLALPISLAGTAQTWSLPDSQLIIDGNVTGATTDVTANMTGSPSNGSTNLDLGQGGPNQVETHSFSAVGGDSTQTGQNAGNNGFLNLHDGDLNGASSSTTGTAGDPVNVTDVAIGGPGTLGSLNVTGGLVNLDQYGSPSTLSVGAATFDPASALGFDFTQNTASGGYSQLNAAKIGTATSGAVDLGGAQMSLANVSATVSGSYDSNGNFVDGPCTEPTPGSVYTLVNAASLTGEVSFDQGGAVSKLADGQTLSTPNCDGSSQDQFRINYSSTAVTLTVLDPTTTTVSAASSTPQVNQPDRFTATVTAPSGSTPAGTVSFADWSGNTLTGCDSVPLSNSAPYTATCTASFNQSGQLGIGATFNPAGTTHLAPSSGGTTINVAAIPGASSSDSAGSSSSSTPATATNPDNGVSATASGGTGTVTVSNYTSDPASAPTFNSGGEYFDVQLAHGSDFADVSITVPGIPSGGSLYWFNPSGGWEKVVGGAGSTSSVLKIDGSSSPTVSQLTGTIFAVAVPGGTGYDLFASDGGVFNFATTYHGSLGGTTLNKPIVGGARASDGSSYYMVAADGGVFNFGPGATFHGSAANIKLNKPIVGMAVDTATGGYWLVTADGGVFNYDAPLYGSMASKPLNQPIVGIAAAPGGQGYYLVAKDGGVFNFGPGATFQGSAGNRTLNKPIVGMAVDTATGGYWLVASDGGVFNYAAPMLGSMAAKPLNQPVVGVTAAPGGQGYYLVASDGGVFNMGSGAVYEGSMGGKTLNKPIVGMAAG